MSRCCLFFQSGCSADGGFACAVTVQRWPDAQKKLEGIAEIVAVVTIESVRATVDCKLSPESDVQAVAVRQVADVSDCVSAYGKNPCVGGWTKYELVPGFFHAFPAEVNGVAATLII